MATASPSRVTSIVKRQYESFPYPHREPKDELTQMLMTDIEELSAINHYCFAGRRDFTRSMRVLVAGGGTGDATTFLARQLQETDAKIVQVDMCEASLNIARQRIKCAGVEHKVEFHQANLLELPALDLGPFDYINCSGVLHHLPDPNAGLAVLRSVLKDDGAMGIMVYGQYGRTGIYHMQELMQVVNQGVDDMQQKLENTIDVMQSLPETNWLSFKNTHVGKVDAGDPAEVYDRFLHSQDRAYTIPQLYEFLDGAGLHLASFARYDRLLYEPEVAFTGELLQKVLRLSPRQRQAVTELFWGSLAKHTFWATPRKNSEIDPEDLENIPHFIARPQLEVVRDAIKHSNLEQLVVELKRKGGMAINTSLRLCPIVRRSLELIDGNRTLDDIFILVMDEQDLGLSRHEVEKRFHVAFQVLKKTDLVLMRHRSVPQVGI